MMKAIVVKDRSFVPLKKIQQKILIYPADTVFGIGAYVYNKVLNIKIFSLKKRSFENPLIVLCNIDFVKANAFIDSLAINLLNAGATVILKNKTNLPFYVSKESKTAYRLAGNQCIKKLVKHCPLTSTSVNLSSRPPLNSIRQIIKHYGNLVDIIINGHIENIASTIVDFENKTILREGFQIEAIKKILGGIQ